MTHCPNCGYELVLLLSRPKYKCALCSKLFPQKEIEFRDFRGKNKLQRGLDLQEIEREYEKQWKQFRDLRKGIQRLFIGYSTIPKEKMKKYHRKWRTKNKTKLMVNRNEVTKLKKKDKIYNHRLKQRLAYWRAKQKDLALQFLRNNKQEASSEDIFQTPFVFSLSDLLLKRKLI